MRSIAKFMIRAGAFMALSAGLAACGQASAGVTQWHGLCIPSERITSLQGSAFGEAIAHMKTDVSVTPEVTMQFSSDELAREISGYIPEIPGKVGTYMGSTVVVWPLPDAARPGGPAHFIQEDRDLWNLTGWWKDSSVLKVPGTNLYRVTRPENQKYDDFFELVSID